MRTSQPTILREAARRCSSLVLFSLTLIAALSFSASSLGQSNQPDLVKLCSITDFSDAANGHGLFLANIAGIPDNKYEFFPGAPGTLELFSDGTAKLKGRVRNKTDQTLVWDIDFHYTGGADWTTWNSGGGNYKDEASLAGSNYLDWDYFIFDASESNTLTGVDGLAGSALTVTHKPANFEFGLQIGTAANSKNANDGASVWFFIDGTVLGNTVSGHGDLNLNTACSEILTNCPLEQYAAGDHILWLPGVAAAGSDWVPAPFGVYFAELAGGEARLYGEIQNQNDPSLVLCVDFWFSDKSDFATWSGLGRSIKGNASNINGNEVNWDFYIFNPDRVSSLSGCSPSTLGSYITVEHNPADYNFGLQVGLGANDKNAQFGLSTWFFTEGVFQGNPVSGQGDVNSINLCPPPPDIVCIENPPVITCPADVMVDCSADTAPEFLGEATADRPTPECPLDVAIFFEDDIEINGCETVITRTWTVIDEYDNTVSCDQIITVIDTTAPELEMPQDLDGEITCSDISLQDAQDYANNALSTADSLAFLASARQLFIDNGLIPTGTTDDCNGSDWEEIAIEVSVSEDCSALATLSCIFIAVDDCGNASEPTATILNIIDNTAPVITCPADATADCTADNSPASTGTATATDDCGDATVTFADGGLSGDGCVNTFTRTWTATDACGNTSTCDQVITITDTTAPELEMPQDLDGEITCSDISLQDAQDYANNALSTADSLAFLASARQLFIDNGLIPTGTTDDCNGSDWEEIAIEVSVSEDCSALATLSCIFVAVDDCGNTSESIATILNIIDNTAPVITCPADAVVSCNDDTSPVVLGMATATDDCNDVIDISFEDSAISGTCPEVFTRTWTASDACGNLSTCDQLITIADNEAPVKDPNCEEPPMTFFTSGGADCPSGAVIDVVVGDEIDETGLFTIAGLDLGTMNMQLAPCFSDNCTDDLTYLIRSVDNGDALEECSKTIVVEIEAVDDCGNVSIDALVCTFIIEDDEAPIKDPTCEEPPMTLLTSEGAVCPSDAVADLQAGDVIDENALFTVAGIDMGAMGAQLPACFSDNCADALTYIVRNVDNGGAEECSKTITIEIEAADDCGNVSVDALVCTFIIEDDEAPIKDPTCEEPPMTLLTSEGAVCPSDAVADLQAGDVIDENALFTVAGIDMGAMGAQLPACFSDNCADALTYIVRNVDNGDPSETCSKTITIEIEAADDCGNVSTDALVCTFIIVDDVAPVITCPADATADCTADNSPASTGTATATDDCGDATVTFADGGLSGDGCVNTFTRTWTATDACGNTSTCDQVITITDTTAPELEMPQDLDGEITCSDISLEDAQGFANNALSTSDSLAFLASARQLFIDNGLIPLGTTDDCNGSDWEEIAIEVSVSEDCSALATLSCIFVAVDDCGNTSESIATILNIIDNTAPVITCPQDEAVSCTDDISPAALGTATATDDCGGDITVTFADSGLSGDGCVDTFTRTWTATDACGNASTCDQIITITDDEAPVAPAAPDNATASCDEEVPAAPELTAADACQGDVIGVLSEEIIEGDCANNFTIVRTWTFDDGCGNVSSVSSEVVVSDTEAPLKDPNCEEPPMTFYTSGDGVDCPSDATIDVQIGDEIDEFGLFTVAGLDLGSMNMQLAPCFSDNCTDDLTYIVRDVDNGDPSETCSKTLTVEIEAVDECGNVSVDALVCTFIIEDDVAPVITCPADVEVDCTADNSPASTGTATATDDCGDATVTFADGGLSGDGCVNTFTRTWTATDACGNTSTCDQVITITDTTAPELEMPQDLDGEITCSDISLQDAQDYANNALSTADSLAFLASARQLFIDNGLIPTGTTDDCNGSDWEEIAIEVSVSEDCSALATLSCIFIAVDDCGNASEPTATILNIIDNTAPVITCPADATADCTADNSPASTGTATATDDCGDATVTFADGGLSGDGCVNTFTRTWTATDACGNTSTCDQVITITDTTAPELEMPQDLDGEITCSDISLQDAQDYANNALSTADSLAFLASARQLFIDNGLIPTGTTDDCNGSDWEEIAIEVSVSEDCSALATLSCIFIAVDDCGNASAPTATILNIIDNTAPVITCPSDATADCTADNSPAATGTATATDDCGDATVTYADGGLSGDGCVNTFTRTWTATDACGNTSTCDQVITITDTTAPELEMPQDLDGEITCSDISLQDAQDYANNALSTADSLAFLASARQLFIDNGLIPTGTTDDCNGSDWEEIAIEVSVSEDCSALATLSCIFIAVDDCGNASEPTATILNIIDNTAPVITCPADATADCTADNSPASTGTATATDDCGDATVTFADGGLSGDGCVNTFTRTWTATDACGNTSTCDQVITITDTTAPELEMPQDLDGEITCSDISLQDAQDYANNALSTADSLAFLASARQLFIDNGLIPTGTTDDCNGSDWEEIAIEVSVSEDCSALATLSCIFVAVDDCGNTSESIATILNIIDNTAPVITCPADATVDCTADNSPAATGTATATDDCGDATVTFADGGLSGDGCVNTFTRTWTATDACGNTSTCDQVITITDTTAPELEMPQDLDGEITCSDISLQDAQDYANNTLSTADSLAFLASARQLFIDNGLIPLGTTDDCNGSDWEEIAIEVSVSEDCSALATLSCIFIAVDDCGNASEPTATILNIIDNTAPVITCPADVEVDCTADNSPASTGTATATDDCGDATVTFADGGLSGDGCVNTFTRTWTATDACGNTSTCDQVITITDTTAPELEMPQDLDGEITCSDISLEDAQGFANNALSTSDSLAFLASARQLFIDNGLIPLGTTDDCNGSDWEEIAIEVSVSEDCSALATLSCIFVAVDDCGNTSESIATILNIIDNTAPVITCPQDEAVSCTDDISPAALGTATATDDCGGDITVTFADSGLSGDGCVDTFTRTWTATDACGNASTCDQIITITDDEAPVAPAAPDNATASCDEEVPAAPELTAADACQGDVIGVLSEEIIEGDCANNFTIVRTWTFDDGCGNVSSVSSEVVVSDTDAPVFDLACAFVDIELFTSQGVDCPSDAGFSFAEGDEFTVNDGYTIGGVDILPLAGCVFDNCTAADDLIIRVAAITESGDDCVKAFTVDFEAIDECGNVGGGFSCNYFITDDVAPVITCPADVEVDCTADNSPASTGTATATDDCGDATVTFADGGLSGDGCVNTFTRTWTATDACGNTSTCDQVITITDTTAPELEMPQDLDGEITCSDISLEDAQGFANNALSTSDSLAFLASARQLFIDNGLIPLGTTDDCNGSDWEEIAIEVSVSEDCSALATLSCIFVAVDDCGNTSESIATILNIIDNTAPVITCPQDEAVSCTDDISPAALGTATATDDCGGDITVTFADSGLSGDGCVDTFTRTWTATDACGNASTCDQIITITDDEAPVAPAAPDNATASCDEEVPAAPELTAADACQGDVIGVLSEEIIEGDCANNFTIVRTWTFDDGCGNVSSVSSEVVVSDTDAPVFDLACAFVDIELFTSQGVDCPSDAGFSFAEGDEFTVNDGYTIGGVDILPLAGCVFDNCTAADDLIIRVAAITESGDDCVKAFTVDFEAIDECGNVGGGFSCNYFITDDVAPVITCPADVEVDCTADNSPASTGTATATDDCGDATVTFADGGLSGDGCVNTFTRTWTATDACGNTSTCDQVITITDTTAPELEMPQDLDGEITCSDISLEDAQGFANNALSTSDSLAFLASARQLFIDNGLIPLGTTDDCNGSDWEEIAIEVSVSEDCSALATLSCIFVAVDDCGNTSESIATILNIIDNTAPVITCPQDEAVSCTDDISPAALGTATATDDCGGDITVTFADSGLSGDGCVDTFTRTWTATDACGNASTCDQIITITDDEAPVAPAAPDNATASCDEEVPAAPELTAADACQGDVIGVLSEEIIEGDCANNFTIVRTWTFDDGCGNVSSVSSEVVVSDTDAPVFDLACAFVDIELFTSQGVDCPSDAGFSFAEGDEFTVNDGYTIGGVDILPLAGCVFDNCTAADDLIIRVAAITESGDDCVKAFTVDFEAIDECGNVGGGFSCNYFITDDVAPVITCPADVEVDCTADNSPASTGTATATDDCGDATVTFADGGLSGDGCVNTFTRTWTATDACGNTSTCDQVITITDTTAPELEMPQDLDGEITCSDISLEDAQGFANNALSTSDSLAFLASARQLFIDNGLIPLGTTDDCNGSDWEEIAIEVSVSEDCSALATLSCIFVAVDDCGNTSESIATILNIIDNTAPVITCPQDEAVSCTDDISPAALGTATATDDCGGDITVTFADSGLSGDGCVDTFTRTWTATDACGNASTCDQIITITDDEAPVAPAAPDNATASCDEEVPAAPELTAADACQGDVIGVLSEEIIEGDCANNFTIVRTWTFDDGCGNVSSVSSEVVVSDTDAPVFDLACAFVDIELFTSQGVDCPSDAGFSFAEGDEFTVNDGYTIGGVDILPLAGCVFDNCTAADDLIIRVAAITESGDDCVKAFTVDFEAIDECGNVGGGFSCNYFITDDVAPVITCPADVEVDCTADNSPASTGTATATDDCGDATVTFADGGLSGDGCVNTFTRTWTATDACGNTSTCDQVITITDTTAPELEMPQDLDGEITCSDISLEDAQGFANNALSTSDSLAFLASARQLFIDNGLIPLGTTDDCNGSDWEEIAIEVSVSEDCSALATLSCIFVAVDDCGNTSESIATILNIIDNTAPVITCPQDEAVSCTDDISPAALGTATATDDCGGDITVTFADSGLSGDGCVDTFTRTWTATDACGNASTCDQIITITDDEAPVAPAAPDNATASCDEEVPAAPELTAADACQGDVIGVLSEEIIEGDCANNFTIVRTWTFDDGCGNVSSVSSEVVVSDTDAPVFDLACAFVDIELFTSQGVDCPSDAGFSFAEGDEFTVNDGYTIGGVDILPLAGCVFDNCTAADDLIIRVAAITESGDDCVKAFTVDFEAIDECGNVGGGFSCNYFITDDVAPVITCPADVEVDCTADNSPASTGTATATDDCGDATVTFADGGLSGDGCVNTFTRTWTATDACGNTSTCDQVITITDTTAPELDMPEESSMHITCMAVDYAMLLDYVDGSLSATQMSVYESFLAGIFMQNGLVPTAAIDDCNDASFTETGIEISTDVDCPSKATVRCVFVAVDACGNESEPVYTELVVIDNTTPHIFCPADIVVTCGSDTSPDVTGFATATDNCIGLVEVTYEDLYVSDICPSSFIRVWSAADECGNVATCEQLITTVQEGDCVTAPNGLEAQVVGSNSIHFSWNPVPNSVACRVFGRPSGGSSNLTLGTIMGTEPSELTFTSSQLQDGLLIEWRVICACELDPLMTSPYSPWAEFYFMGDDNKNNDASNDTEEQLNEEQLKGELYPNPTRTSVFINSVFEEGDILTVMDLSGKVVGQYNVPVASGLFEINLAELESGVYFVQHSGLNGRSQTFKVVKNN